MGVSEREAARQTQISYSTVKRLKNDDPEFVEEVERHKSTIYVKARKALYENIEDPKVALQYLKLRHKDEFNTLVQIEPVMTVNPFGGRSIDELKKRLKKQLSTDD